MEYLRVKNWDEFQHYKDRNPPWIKLHRGLLDDYEFGRLQDASKAHLMLIWIFASQNSGRVPADPKFLQAKLSLDKQPDLNALVEQGFLLPEQVASNPLAERKQDDSDVLSIARSREKRREETETRFSAFWTAYPRRVAKPAAFKAFERLNPDDMLMATITEKLATATWPAEQRFIPHPATWLNERRWEDETGSSESKRMVM